MRLGRDLPLDVPPLCQVRKEAQLLQGLAPPRVTDARLCRKWTQEVGRTLFIGISHQQAGVPVTARL